MDEVVRTATFDAPVVDVWSAVTEPEQLTSWLGEIVDLELAPGGRLTIREPDGTMLRGVVEAVEPPTSLILRWRRHDGTAVADPRRVELRIEPDGTGSRLTVVETATDTMSRVRAS